MKKNLRTLFLLLVIMLLTAACGNSSTNTKENANEKSQPIKIGFSALPSWYLWHLVEEKGFFKKHGVNVELVWFPVYADSLSALNTGKIDANSQALIDTLSPLEKGLDLKVVFITDNSLGGDGLVATKDIKTVADLKGKKIGTEIGTIEHFFMLTALKEAGLSESDVNFTNLTVQDAGNSFIAGNLDAAGLWEPFLSMAVEKGKGHKLVTSADFPGLISDVFVVRGDVVNNRKEDIQKIVAAWFDAVDYFSKNYDESIQLIAEKAGISKEELAAGMEGFKLFSPEESLEAFKEGNTYQSIYYTAQKNAEFLKDLGFIKKIPDLSRFVDPAFIKEEVAKTK
ncbi:NitT/TauT family transport system substrate-binding protein [Anoxybacillus tepidamans]|uniref:NitT/TauT family transport system substrate-binding protein n=1 Tax=Anoxybacteroides tepidamans TaxID=265948 RepID=A0A7W8IMK3_9BACL|nr:ABC transporter substrate-binding protein [Anoxybacillus tepidamans]MBB5323245.1 NitT/TauT family transport system substrate-binding protein [Anoxybacillus tepidamans]